MASGLCFRYNLPGTAGSDKLADFGRWQILCINSLRMYLIE